MYNHGGEDIFVFDDHVHFWDASHGNVIHEGGDQFIESFFGGHQQFTPEHLRMDEETFRKFSKERFVEDVFANGYVDCAMFQPTYLRAFYDHGFNTVERNAELVEAYPERFVLNGWMDPRDGEEGLEYLEWQKETFDINGVKLYTAAWNGDSKGYKLSSEMSYRYLDRCRELGIKNIHAHKGPTLRPLNLDAFDVRDVDEAASLYTDLNFVVEHSGVPRLDDFVWFAHQEPNVYAGLALIAGFATVRPQKFRNILGELLHWLGEDKLVFGSDYAICQPSSVIESVMETEFTPDERAEFGVGFDIEAKRKLFGENLAGLYDIDLAERKQAIEHDTISREYDLEDDYAAADFRWAGA